MIVYDDPTRKETDVDIAMVFALSAGYRAPASAFGVTGHPGSKEYVDGVTRIYEHGKRWGKLVRTTAGGRKADWILPTEGRWPTVAETLRRFKTHPPNTKWMTGAAPDLSCYTGNDGFAGGGVGARVEQLSLGDLAFEHNVFADNAQ